MRSFHAYYILILKINVVSFIFYSSKKNLILVLHFLKNEPEKTLLIGIKHNFFFLIFKVYLCLVLKNKDLNQIKFFRDQNKRKYYILKRQKHF